jgi:hypothetical protein
MIAGFQREAEEVIRYIVAQAESQMKTWLASFMQVSIEVGSAYLYGTPEPAVSYAPLYENYMVKKQLGQLEAFRESYGMTREQQAMMLITEGPLSKFTAPRRTESDESIKRLKSLFSAIAGFFLIETRISWDGFALIPQSRLDEIWRSILSAACVPMGHLKNQMMAVSRQITLFCEKMDQCSLSCVPFQQFIAKQVRPFKVELMHEFSSDAKKIIEEHSNQLAVFHTPDEYATWARFCLCETPTRYPYEAKFVASMPLLLARIEESLKQWSEFSGKSGDRAYIDTYETLMGNVITALSGVAVALTQIPNVGFFISSMLCFHPVLNYFDQWIQQMSTAALRPDTDRFKRKVQEQTETLVDHVKALFRLFVGELLSPQTLRTMSEGKPPHNFSFELVTYLETMSATLRPLLPPGMFIKIIENVAVCVAESFADAIIAASDLKWNAEFVWKAQQNLRNIENWPTLIALPTAKQQLSGLSTMFAKLLSSQLSAFAADAQFAQACKALPMEAMYAILSKYSQTKTKEYYSIPSSLVKSLLAKMAPLVKLSQATKGKR